MKKELVGRLFACVLLCLVLYGVCRYYLGTAVPENVLPPMVMADGTVWQLYSESDGGLSRKSDGSIREIIGNEIPGQEGQANFGTVGMPYWNLTDGLMVYVNGKYYIMKAFQE